MTAVGSTLTGNSAVAPGNGGGIHNEAATLTILNSTLSGNTAASGGALITRSGTGATATVEVLDSTLGGNVGAPGGDILNRVLGDGTATVTLGNAICRPAVRRKRSPASAARSPPWATTSAATVAAGSDRPCRPDQHRPAPLVPSRTTPPRRRTHCSRTARPLTRATTRSPLLRARHRPARRGLPAGSSAARWTSGRSSRQRRGCAVHVRRISRSRSASPTSWSHTSTSDADRDPRTLSGLGTPTGGGTLSQSGDYLRYRPPVGDGDYTIRHGRGRPGGLGRRPDPDHPA